MNREAIAYHRFITPLTYKSPQLTLKANGWADRFLLFRRLPLYSNQTADKADNRNIMPVRGTCHHAYNYFRITHMNKLKQEILVHFSLEPFPLIFSVVPLVLELLPDLK